MLNQALCRKASMIAAGGILGLLAVSLVSPADADIRWKTEMKIDTGMMGAPAGGRPGGTPGISYTTIVKQGVSRKESQFQMGRFSSSDVILTLCDKRQRVQIDDELKIYTVATLTGDEPAFANPVAGMASAISKMLPPGMKLPGMPQTPAGAPATGKIVSSYALQDMGEETVADTKTRRWLITITNEKSGCAGTGTDSTRMEVWSADFNEPIICPDVAPANPIRDAQSAMAPQCKITFETKGDGMEAYSKIFRGIIMRLKIYDKNNKPMVTQEVTMITRAPQEDAVFQIPTGYKEVNAEQFGQLKTQALIQKMLGGFALPNAGG